MESDAAAGEKAFQNALQWYSRHDLVIVASEGSYFFEKNHKMERYIPAYRL